MDPQKQLESLIEKSIIYIHETDKNKQVFSEMFSGNENNDINEFITSLNGEQLYLYFKISQISLDLQNIFTEIAYFIHFCKKNNIELDLSTLNKSDKLLSFISNFKPFNLEFVPNEDNILVEKNKKELDKKFKVFKKSISSAINIL